MYPIAIENSNTLELTGILPLAKVKNFLSGSKLVSFPFSTHCEPLIAENLIKRVYDEFYSEQRNYHYMELRSLDYSCTMKEAALNENYLIHILELNESEDNIFQEFHGTSVRASIRRAEKNRLTFEINNSTFGLKAFYSLYTDLRKRLGLPFLPYKFFNSIYTNLIKDDRIFIPLVKYENSIIAAGFILKFKDTYYLEYTASDNSRFNLYPNHKLFWEIIKIAIKNKAKYVDFGRTEVNNNSLITFKEKWNTKRRYLKYWKISNKGMENTIAGNKKSFIIKINKHIPKSLLKLQGKILYKYNG